MIDLEKLELKHRKQMDSKDYQTLYFISIILYVLEKIEKVKTLEMGELLIGFCCENIFNDFKNYINSCNENKDFNIDTLKTNLMKLGDICETLEIELPEIDIIIKRINNVSK